MQALLAGFAWYGLTEVPFDQGADVYTQTLYLVVATLIMGLELLTVVNATLCAILGPGLVRAWRGGARPARVFTPSDGGEGAARASERLAG